MERMHIPHTEFAQLSDEIFDRGNALRFVAHGTSMTPFIRGEDILTVEPVEAAQFKPGEVVFYQTQGSGLMAHRIIDLLDGDDQRKLRTRGDGSPGSEEVINPDQVLGLVTTVQRGERTFQINRGLWRILGLLWIRLYPLPYLLYRIARKIGSSLGRSEPS